jgi:hypothetical protein
VDGMNAVRIVYLDTPVSRRGHYGAENGNSAVLLYCRRDLLANPVNVNTVVLEFVLANELPRVVDDLERFLTPVVLVEEVASVDHEVDMCRVIVCFDEIAKKLKHP